MLLTNRKMFQLVRLDQISSWKKVQFSINAQFGSAARNRHESYTETDTVASRSNLMYVLLSIS